MDPIVEQAWMVNSQNSILVQIHSDPIGDPFNTPEMIARLNLYSSIPNFFTGYPTCYVDGLIEPPYPYNIGNVTTEINNRLMVFTPVTLQPTVQSGTNKIGKTANTINYTFIVKSEEVVQSQNLRFFVFPVEDGINYNASNGTTVHNHVARDIVPDQNGIPVDLSDSNQLEITIEGNLEIDQNWDQENLSLVGILQDIETREVYQAEIISLSQLSTDDGDNISIPKIFELKMVYPNPFNPTINIELSIANNSPASLTVYDIRGKEVDIIFENKSFNPGEYIINWNAQNYSTGSYIFKFEHENGLSFKKAILLK